MSIIGLFRGVGPLTVMLALSWPGVCRAQPGIPDSGKSDPNDHQPHLALDTGGHTSAVYKLLLNGYGDQLISVGLDKTIRFWDVKTGEPLRVLRVPRGSGTHGWLYSAAISPDGNMLAVGGYRAMTPLYDHRILLIGLPEGQLLRTLKGHAYSIYDVAFSPDGQQLASASHDGTVRIWNPQTGETIHELKGHTSVVHAVAWSPDGKRLISGSMDGTARIWSAETGAEIAVLNGHGGPLMTVAWRPDGVSAATGCDDKIIRLFDRDGKLQFASSPLSNQISSLSFSRDSRQLLFTYCAARALPWGAGILDMVTGRERMHFDQHPNGVISSFMFADGKTAVTGDSVSNIFMWDTTSGAVIHRLASKGRPGYAAGWSPDGGTIAWGNTNRAVLPADFPLERTFSLRTLQFGPSPNGSYHRALKTLGPLQVRLGSPRVATFLVDGQINAAYTLPQPHDRIKSTTLLGNNRAALGTESGVYVVDCNNGQLIGDVLDHGEEVVGLAPSPDRRYLLSAGNDQMLHISNLETNKLVLSLFIAGDEWIAWTPEGFYAASAAGESLMGWQVNHGLEALPSFYPAGRFHKTFYRPDVIRRVIDAGGAEPAAKLADAERGIEWRPLVLKNVLPPKVAIAAPVGRTTVSEATVEVQATARASGEEPVLSLRLFLDGRPGELKTVPADAQDAAATVRETWQVPLTPGPHEIVIKADTAASDSVSAPIEVTSSVDKKVQRALYVLAMGAAHGTSPASRSAAGDAQAVADAWQQRATSIYQPVEARVLAGDDASREKIVAGMAWLAEKCGPDDLAVIFYRGASARNAAGTLFLSASNTRADALDQTAIADVDLKRAVQIIRGNVLVLLDAATPLVEGQNPTAGIDHLVRELLRDDYGAGVISITGVRNETTEPTATDRGVLAKALIDGLHGGADTNQDRIVHWNEFEGFVTARVKSDTHDQRHATAGRAVMIRSMPLAEAPAK